MRMFFSHSAITLVILLLSGPVFPQETILVNPTKRSYQNELVQLKMPPPAGSFIVKHDGFDVPFQVENSDGKRAIWICADFEPGATHSYQIIPGQPRAVKPKVAIRKEGAHYVLDNGNIAIRVPAQANSGIPGPIAGIKLGDKWVGDSFWNTSFPLKKFTTSILGDGTLFAKIRLHYAFDGHSGLDGNVSAFTEIDVSLGLGWNHAEIFERHEMARGDYWKLDTFRRWSPRQGISQPFSAGAGSGKVVGKIEPQRALKPGGIPFGNPDLFIRLLPRWNQHYRDGWFFAATDGKEHVGALAVRAGQWVWPHNNAIEVMVKPTGDYAGLRCSTWKGQRQWWLFSPSLAPTDIGYVTRYAWENLDKLNHEFILDWPGQKGSFSGMNFYNGQDRKSVV